MATSMSFRELHLPQQKYHHGDVMFPAVLSPKSSTDSVAFQLQSFKGAIKAHKPWLESLLVKSGAILFRDFPVTSPSDFNTVIEAFDYPEFPYDGGVVPRTQVVGKVYTANESPLDIEVPFHHEMAYASVYPTKLFFYCDVEPGRGGETPIVLSNIIYEKMKERHPNFVAQLEEHGLRYIKIAGDKEDSSSYMLDSWKSLYKTNDKKIVEERVAKLGGKVEWMGDTAKLISKPMPAIKFDDESRQKTWFNSLAASYSGPANEKISTSHMSVILGNGEPLDDDAMKYLLKILEEECVAIPWKKGDVMLVNNLTVLHGRRPLVKPPRRVLASLCK